MSKLHDPDLSLGAIVKKFDDGGALRNDGVRLKPANQNPWYVLATLHGELHETDDVWKLLDDSLPARNRAAWQRWTTEELTSDDLRLYEERLGEGQKPPSPRERVIFSDTHFPVPVVFAGFIFEKETVFSRAVFKLDADFRDARFENASIFEKTHFTKSALFHAAIFAERAGFTNTWFEKGASFPNARFLDYGDFLNAHFREHADFADTIFNGASYFFGSEFECSGALFANAQFRGVSFFHSGTIKGEFLFTGAEFTMDVEFRALEIQGASIFEGVRFHGKVDFSDVIFAESTDFNSATFKASTRFDGARFLSHVPEFHAAELYEDTVFPIPNAPTANWPPQSGEGVMPADEQKRAYSRLRQFFAKTQQIDEEQFFHRQEMRCKRAMAGWATKGMYSVYSALSDYGISIWRPLAYLILLTVLGGDLLGAHRQALGKEQDWATLGENMGWSLANLVPFTGFGRTFFGADFYQSLPGWLQAFAGAQTLAAIPLLFLLGLGLRNTFRLR